MCLGAFIVGFCSWDFIWLLGKNIKYNPAKLAGLKGCISRTVVVWLKSSLIRACGCPA